MVVRRNSMKGREFLGCTNYPFCEKTYPTTEVIRHQVQCPQCGGWMVKRSGLYGEFYGCTNYPDCKATIDIASSGGKGGGSHRARQYPVPSRSIGAPRAAEHLGASRTYQKGQTKDPLCPKCGSPMLLRTSKFGQFYGCSRYPSCKGTRPQEY